MNVCFKKRPDEAMKFIVKFQLSTLWWVLQDLTLIKGITIQLFQSWTNLTFPNWSWVYQGNSPNLLLSSLSLSLKIATPWNCSLTEMLIVVSRGSSHMSYVLQTRGWSSGVLRDYPSQYSSFYGYFLQPVTTSILVQDRILRNERSRYRFWTIIVSDHLKLTASQLILKVENSFQSSFSWRETKILTKYSANWKY